MLRPEYFDYKSDKILELYRKLEDWILQDISNRLLFNEEMSATADRLIWKLESMGESKQDIQSKLAEITGMTQKEVRELLKEAVLTSWEDDRATFKAMGIEISNPLNNKRVIEVMNAEYAKTLSTFNNLTKTTMETYQSDLMRMLDEAEMRTASGVQSYSGAVCNILDAYAKKGVEVTYPTGAKLTIESAVNLIVRTSLNQTSAQVTNQYIREAGTNYVLVSAHYGARTAQKGQPPLADHNAWQGKVYCIDGSEDGIPNLLESTGYNIDANGNGYVVDPLGLHGYNCRHSHQPWDKNLENPWIDENGNPKIDPEKSAKQYEAQQKARAMERAIRSSKRELLVKAEELKTINSPELKDKLENDYARIAYRLRQQNKAYNDYCESQNIPKQYDRIKVGGFGSKEASKANSAATKYGTKK